MRLPDPTRDDVRDLRRGRIGAAVVAVVGAVAALLHLSWRPAPLPSDDRDLVAFVRAAAADAQDFWAANLAGYERADVVLFAGAIRSLCGLERTWQGPGYCPTSGEVFVDLEFLRGIAGTAPRAYVVAHELAHHAQRIGRSPALGAARELQADCLAGAWLGDLRRRGFLLAGDLVDVERAAGLFGDDVMDGGTGGHGTSAQRVASARLGAMDGLTACGAR